MIPELTAICSGDAMRLTSIKVLYNSTPTAAVTWWTLRANTHTYQGGGMRGKEPKREAAGHVVP